MKEILECPCKCKMWVENKTFYVKPCSLNCEYYLYALEQSKKQGNKIIMRYD